MTETDKALRAYADAWEYVPDRKGFLGGQWRFPDPKRPRGDCEDFALGVSRILFPTWRAWLRALLRRDFEIWTGTSTSGNRHAVLFVPGPGWIDNWPPRAFERHTEHDMKRAYSPWFVLFKLVPEIVWVAVAVLAAIAVLRLI